MRRKGKGKTKRESFFRWGGERDQEKKSLCGRQEGVTLGEGKKGRRKGP